MVVELWSSQGVSMFFKKNRRKKKIITFNLTSILIYFLDTPAETLQLFVTPNHISFHIMNEAQNLGCTTRTGLPNNVKYCRYLVICDYAPGTTYYIQVTDTHSIDVPHVDVPYFHHKIRV